MDHFINQPNTIHLVSVLRVLPVLGLVDVHAAVVPGELLARLDALVLRRELAGPVLLELLDVGVEGGDGDGRVGEHPRGLEVHPPQLDGVRGRDHRGVGHVEAGHERRGHLPAVHGLLERLVAPPEHDDEDDQEGETNAGHDRADHPDEVGAGSVAGDQVAVNTAAVSRRGGWPGGAGGVGLWKYLR